MRGSFNALSSLTSSDDDHAICLPSFLATHYSTLLQARPTEVSMMTMVLKKVEKEARDSSELSVLPSLRHSAHVIQVGGPCFPPSYEPVIPKARRPRKLESTDASQAPRANNNRPSASHKAIHRSEWKLEVCQG